MNKRSRLEILYYIFALIGFIATWFYNGQYIIQGGGLGPDEFFGVAFANSLTAAITIDVYLSALVFSIWVINDAKRHSFKWAWVYIILCFSVGLAISLPLYFARREKMLNTTPTDRDLSLTDSAQ